MGTGFSHPPPPLVEISGPRNKVLVPAGTSFTVNPPPFFDGRATQVPAYQPMHSPSRDDRRWRGRPRDRGRRRVASEDTASTSEMSFESGMDMRGRRGAGHGVSLPMGGRRGTLQRASRPYVRGYSVNTPGDLRTHSAPNLAAGYGYPSGRAPPQTGVIPPTYGGGMGAYTYPYQPGQAMPVGQTHAPLTMPMPQQPKGRGSMRPSGLNETPMGVYAAGVAPPAALVRAATEPPISTRLNRQQPSDQEVGPSGQEYIKGDPFLDACKCSTNCECRKGHRVLFRTKVGDGDGQKSWGEIRFTKKEDLGKDCGDHSKCRGQAHDDDDSEDEKKSRTKKRKAKKQNGGTDDFHEEMRDRMNAIQEDLAGMKLQARNNRPGMRTILPQAPPSPHGAFPGMTEGRDARLAPHYEGNPFGMGASSGPPLGRGGRARLGRMPRPGFADPGMRPGMDLEYDEIPDSAFGLEDLVDPMELSGRPPRPRLGGARRPLPPEIMGVPNPRRGRGIGGPRNVDMGVGGYGRGRRQRNGGGRRRPPPPPPDFGDHSVPMDMGMRGGMGGPAGGPRDGYGEMDDDDDSVGWEDQDDGEGGGRMRHSPPGQGGDGGRHVSRTSNAGRQPRVDDVEDDMGG